jgi:hypothetical protein
MGERSSNHGYHKPQEGGQIRSTSQMGERSSNHGYYVPQESSQSRGTSQVGRRAGPGKYGQG